MNTKKTILLIEDILQKATEVKTSEILPKTLTLSKILEDKAFEKWVLLESSGYFNTNPALTKEVKVPEYRKVAGQYHDLHDRPLIFGDAEMAQIVNNYSIRESIAELDFTK